MCLYVIFFVQAEDGIRDLVRSRGLGDVYKRQGYLVAAYVVKFSAMCQSSLPPDKVEITTTEISTPVSYTHLTLPTSDLV